MFNYCSVVSLWHLRCYCTQCNGELCKRNLFKKLLSVFFQIKCYWDTVRHLPPKREMLNLWISVWTGKSLQFCEDHELHFAKIFSESQVSFFALFFAGFNAAHTSGGEAVTKMYVSKNCSSLLPMILSIKATCISRYCTIWFVQIF